MNVNSKEHSKGGIVEICHRFPQTLPSGPVWQTTCISTEIKSLFHAARNRILSYKLKGIPTLKKCSVSTGTTLTWL